MPLSAEDKARLKLELDKLDAEDAEIDAELAKLPGYSIDTAKPTDLYGSARMRMGASFGNAPGLTDELRALGYADPTTDSEGRIVAQGEDGRYYRDDDAFFNEGPYVRDPEEPWTNALKNVFEPWLPNHPLRALESALGPALREVGMVAGAVGGAGAGTVAGTPVGGFPGALVGAGLGRGLGELLRAGAGAAMGTFDAGPSGARIAGETTESMTAGMLMEAVGGAVGRLPVRWLPGVGRTVAPHTLPVVDDLAGAGALRGAKTTTMRSIDETLGKATLSPDHATDLLGQYLAATELTGVDQMSKGEFVRLMQKYGAAPEAVDAAARMHARDMVALDAGGEGLQAARALLSRTPEATQAGARGMLESIGARPPATVSELLEGALSEAGSLIGRAGVATAEALSGVPQNKSLPHPLARVFDRPRELRAAEEPEFTRQLADEVAAKRDQMVVEGSRVMSDARAGFRDRAIRDTPAEYPAYHAQTDEEFNVLRDFLSRREATDDIPASDRDFIFQLMRALQFTRKDSDALGRADLAPIPATKTVSPVGVWRAGQAEPPPTVEVLSQMGTAPSVTPIHGYNLRDIEGQPYYLTAQHPARVLDVLDMIDSRIPKPGKPTQDVRGDFVGDKTSALLKRVRYSLKAKIKALDPEYARKNDQYAELLDETGFLAPLQNKATRESFLLNLFNEGKYEQQRVFQKFFPDEFEKTLDYYASEAFNKGDDARLRRMSTWLGFRLGGAVGAGVSTGSLPLGAAAAAGTLTATSPTFQRAGFEALGGLSGAQGGGFPARGALNPFRELPIGMRDILRMLREPEGLEPLMGEAAGSLLPTMTGPYPRQGRGTIPVRADPYRP